MGADKRQALVGSRSMLSRVVAAVSAVRGIRSVAIVAKQPVAGFEMCRFVEDSRRQHAALSGVEAALEDAAGGSQALIVACDYPLLRPATLDALITRSLAHPGMVTLVRSGTALHPLVAVWPTSALALVRSRIVSDAWRIMNVVSEAGFTAADIEELSVPPEELENVNAPDDLTRVRRIDGEGVQSP